MVSSCSVVIFGGEPIWNPLDLLSEFLNDPGEGSSANRGVVFFIAAAFVLAQLGTNTAANSVSAGTDLTALMPRWINIRRGGYLCAVVGLAMRPWNLLSSSNNFTTYLSADSVFLSSFAGVMVCDYYLVRKGYLSIVNLYSGDKNGPYYYTFGFHWRAYVAYICGILINIVGFVGAVKEPTKGRNTATLGAQYIYDLNYFTGFIVAAVVYRGLCKIWPVEATSEIWMENGDRIDDLRLVPSTQSAGSDKGDDERKEEAEREDHEGKVIEAGLGRSKADEMV